MKHFLVYDGKRFPDDISGVASVVSSPPRDVKGQQEELNVPPPSNAQGGGESLSAKHTSAESRS